jgi:hypothetical protein
MNLDQQRLCIDLQRLDWARQLKEEVIQDIAASAELMELQAGQVIIDLDSEINHVYFIVAGRLAGALFDRLGRLAIFRGGRSRSLVGPPALGAQQGLRTHGRFLQDDPERAAGE